MTGLSQIRADNPIPRAMSHLHYYTDMCAISAAVERLQTMALRLKDDAAMATFDRLADNVSDLMDGVCEELRDSDPACGGRAL